MSPGKLAAQVAHASLAFLTAPMRKIGCANTTKARIGGDEIYGYIPQLTIEKDIFEQWICGVFTKTICEAKNRYQLEKAITVANELGLKEGIDYFLIKDCCLTELTPEEVDENGVGRVLTCIGFKPLLNEVAHKISKKYQLYKQEIHK